MTGRWQMDWYNGWSPDERRATLQLQREQLTMNPASLRQPFSS